MAHLQVSVFGKLRIQNDEDVVDGFPTRRAEELLGYLLVNPGERHPREKLVATLWPDVPLSNGRASLSTALWRLRNVFNRLGIHSESYLLATREWISFEPDETLQIDLIQFERHLGESERAKELNTKVNALKEAANLYQGVFCDGIYAEWCLIERERFERRYLRALGSLMGCLIDAGHFGDAVSVGQDILDRDPLREEVHRALMHCYWKMGERSLAIHQFQLCARMLQSELQVLPMPETINLYRQIIEERLSLLWLNNTPPSTDREQLKAAYDRFLSAADSLNALLRTAETRREPVSAD